MHTYLLDYIKFKTTFLVAKKIYRESISLVFGGPVGLMTNIKKQFLT